MAFSPHNFKILATLHMYLFGLVIPLNLFLEIDRNYESIIITVISNITVLVSQNVFCLGYSMPMSYGVNEKTLPIVSLPPFVLSRFSPSLFVVLQGILYQPFFVLIRLLPKIIHFQSKAISFFQLIAGRF